MHRAPGSTILAVPTAGATVCRRRVSARRRLVAGASCVAAAVAAAGCTPGADATRPGEPAGTRAGESVNVVERCADAPGADAAAVQVRTDVPYAVRDGDTLRLDLARPARPGPHPVVVLLHGGGWEGGDRRDMHAELRLLAARGYAAATVGYRLTTTPRHVFPAAVQDVRCAVRWLRTEAGALDLDPARIGALGYSAGAHLASMLGTAAGVAELDAPAPSTAGCLADPAASPAVQAVVSMAGPQDLRVNGPYTAEQARIVTNFLGGFSGDIPAVATLASPIAHASAAAPPFLLVHGTQDDLVPVAHARRMRDGLRGVGVPATLLELRDVGHGLPSLGGRETPSVGCTVLAFLDRWLRAR